MSINTKVCKCPLNILLGFWPWINQPHQKLVWLEIHKSWYGWVPCELSICSSALCSDPSSCLIHNKSRQNTLTCLPVSLVEPAGKKGDGKGNEYGLTHFALGLLPSFFSSCSMMELPNLTAPHFTAFRCL